MTKLGIAVVIASAVALLDPASGRAAGQEIPIVDNVLVTSFTPVPAIDVRKFSEVSFLGTSDGSVSFFVFFLTGAADASTTTPKVLVALCGVTPSSGVVCSSDNGVTLLQTFKVSGPFLGLLLAPNATPQTVTLKLWAQ